MKKLLKKIFLPIFLSVLCGFLCGKLMFSIYEDKEKNILTSNVIYLLEDTSYNDYNTMKSSLLVIIIFIMKRMVNIIQL